MRSFIRVSLSPWLLCPLLGIALLAISLLEVGPFHTMELQVYDRLLALRQPEQTDQVVLVAIDQESRSLLGADTIGPGIITQALKRLDSLGAADIALLQPLSFTEDSTLLETIRQKSIVIALEKSLRESEGSSVPLAMTVAPAPRLGAPQVRLLQRKNPLAQYRPRTLPRVDFLLPTGLPTAENLRAGHLIYSSDTDGRIRSAELFRQWGERLLPAVPLRLALRRFGEEAGRLSLPPAKATGVVHGDQTDMSVRSDFRLLIDFSGTKRPFDTISLASLLDPVLLSDSFAGKTVLIGPTDTLGDNHRITSFGSVSTSELAAWTTATLLEGTPLQRPSWAWLAETMVQLYFIILLMLLTPRMSARASGSIVLLFLLSWAIFAGSALVYFGLWFKIIPAAALCLFGFALLRRQRGHREIERHQQENSRMLSQRFQDQGMLDLALEKALLLQPRSKSNREFLYNLGLECERKRSPHQAEAAYRHLLSGGRFRDSSTRLRQLECADRTMIIPGTDDATIILEKPGEKPTLGRYRIEKELGQGAMGVVYLGVDPKINRQVAIKTLLYKHLDPAQREDVRQRFFREAEAIGRLTHPNLVSIYDIGEERDLAFLAMELLSGRDLSHYCSARNRLSVPEIINIACQVASGLACAHQQGIVHRDIKPANLFLQNDGQVKITDFGIARFTAASGTETGTVLGTPNYMSPEQVSGKKVDGRSDLFSLGIVLYELLSGQKPFQGENITSLMFNITKGRHTPLKEIRTDLPGTVYACVEKLLQKNLTRRYKSAHQLHQDLLNLEKDVA